MSKKNWDDFTDFEDIEPAGGDGKQDFNCFNFDEDKDELHLLCEQFIVEHDLPDDTDPTSLRRRVWKAIGFYNRIKLMFRGIRP